MRRRLATTIGSILLGGLLAAAYLVGGTRATRSPTPASEVLELDDYCPQPVG